MTKLSVVAQQKRWKLTTEIGSSSGKGKTNSVMWWPREQSKYSLCLIPFKRIRSTVFRTLNINDNSKTNKLKTKHKHTKNDDAMVFFLSAKILITGLLFSSYKVRKQVIVWIIDYECRSSYHLMWVCVCVWASERQKKYCTSYQICWIFVYFECVAQLHGTNGCVDNFNMQVFFI